jgi:hypothetical protein
MSLIESSLVAPAIFASAAGRQGRNQQLGLLASAATLSANLGQFIDPRISRSRVNHVWEYIAQIAPFAYSTQWTYLFCSPTTGQSPVVRTQRVDVLSQLIASWRKIGGNIRALLKTISDRCHSSEIDWKPNLLGSRLHKNRPTSP